MGANCRAEQVIGAFGVVDPVPKCFVDRGPERGVSAGHRLHPRPEQPHTLHIGRLALDVDGSHIDGAVQSHAGARRGAGNPVLAGAGLGDDPSCSHLSRQQGLPDGVVDLVGTGMCQILTLQPDLASPGLSKAGRSGQRRRAAHPRRHLVIEGGHESGIVEQAGCSRFQPVECRDQDLGNVPAPEGPEPTPLVGKHTNDCAAHTVTSPSTSTERAAWTNSRIRS